MGIFGWENLVYINSDIRKEDWKNNFLMFPLMSDSSSNTIDFVNSGSKKRKGLNPAYRYNESDKRYKNKILVDKSEYKILKKCLEPDIFSSKKNTNKDLVKVNNHQIDNKIFEDFSIFNKLFDSEKTWSSKDESDDETLLIK